MRFAPIFAATMLFGAAGAQAANFCVGTGAQFTAAMTQAAASNEDDVILLYGTSFTLATAPDVDIRGSLTIRGGFNPGCGLLLSTATSTTIVSQANDAFRLSLRAGDLSLIRVGFSGFATVNIADNGFTWDSIVGDLLVQRVLVSGGGTGMSLIMNGHNARIESSLFVGSTSEGGNIFNGAGLVYRTNSTLSPAPVAEIVNNTAVGNKNGFVIGTGPGNLVPLFANNIAYDNRTTDLTIQMPTVVTNSVWATQNISAGGALAAGSANNSSVNPQLAANFKPIEPTSPVINTGNNAPIGGLPTSDYDGGARLIGTQVDRGAYESSVNNASVLVVVNTNNTGAGSLRQAILDANTSPEEKTIEFNIPGGCPRLINLTTALPAVTAPVTINGYTQPGSAENTDSAAFNGSVCVALTGNAALATGLHLQTGASEVMSVQGLAFYGFTSEGLRLSGAGVANVRGNTFGTGVAAIIVEPGFADAAIRVQNAEGSTIGGYDLGERNVIARAAQAGIRLESSTGKRLVRGNMIGFNLAGTSALANGIGISVGSSIGDEINRNRIGFSTTHGALIEPIATPAQSVRFLSNTFGVGATGAAAGNGSNAVRLSAGENHVVSNNAVRNSGTDGIVVLAAARQVEIDSNYISDNALQAIDLSPDGVNPINLDVGATGANDDQNFPTLLTASGNDGEGEVTGTLASANGTYAIQVFKNETCDANGYGEADSRIARAEVTISNATAVANGTVAFSIPVTGEAGLLGTAITAIATDDEQNSSEASACIPYVVGPLIFRNGFE